MKQVYPFDAYPPPRCSEALLQEIRDIFYGQSDHMVPW